MPGGTRTASHSLSSTISSSTFHPPAPAQDHVHLFLLHVRVAVRKATAGRDALVAQGGLLELERLGRRAELEVRRAVEPRADVLQVLLDVAERERHGAILLASFPARGSEVERCEGPRPRCGGRTRRPRLSPGCG